MNVNNNVITSTSKKQHNPNPASKTQEFKRILNNHELSSKYSDHIKYNKDKSTEKPSQSFQKISKNYNSEKTETEGTSKDFNNAEDTKKVIEKIVSFLETSINELNKNKENPLEEPLGQNEATDAMAQIQELLQYFSSIFEITEETSTTENQLIKLNSINGEPLLGKVLTPETKIMLKNNLSEIVALLEKSKGKQLPTQVLDVLQKITTEANLVKGDLGTLKTTILNVSGNSDDRLIKDTLFKKVVEQSANSISEINPKSQMQNSGDTKNGKEFSENRSTEEKFLSNLLGGDKDEMKITKAVNFMNQFEAVKSLDTSKVENLSAVIDKNNFTIDVIKSIKFMEDNNIKNLTVKMNPKELGEITIKLTMESGIMKAIISAQNKDTFNLLNQNLQEISDRLKNMDIKIQSLDINIYEDSTFFSKDSNQKNSNGRQDTKTSTNMDLEEENQPINNNYDISENGVNKFV